MGDSNAGRGAAAAVAFVVAVFACLSLAAPAALAAPANDDFADRTALNSALPIEETGTTEAATVEGEEAEDWFSTSPAGHSVWFKWTPASTEFVTVSVCHSEISAMVGIFTGSAVGFLQKVAHGSAAQGPHAECWGGESEYSFKALAGTEYKIGVDGNGFVWSPDAPPDTEGPFTLRIESLAPPVNDDFADALPLVLDTVYTGTPSEPFQRSARFGYNWGATKEPGEPNHAGNPGGASVWFTWTAPASGIAEFNVCCFSPELLAIYTGDSVGALTQVLGNNGNRIVPVTAGTTYRIAADGEYTGAEDGTRTGSFGVSASMRLPPIVTPDGPETAADLTPPQTFLLSRRLRTAKRRASFVFGSDDPAARFRCRIDGRPFVLCASGVTYKHLKPGPHRFTVAALDAAGNVDPTPVSARFAIPRPRPRKAAD